MKKINIMGTDYSFGFDNLNNPELAQNDGYCQIFDKNIVVRNQEYMAGISDEAKKERLSHVIRHELIHAVAQECGVQYGEDEVLVDWIAHIIPVVNKAFNDIERCE